MPHKSTREILGGIQPQGTNESIIYSIDTGPWGGTPTSTSHDIFDEEDFDTSLKSSLMSGSTSVSSDNISLPALSGLTEGVIYRVFIKFTITGGSVLEGYFRVKAEL